VVESVMSKPLEKSMAERVFKPLGMSRTSMVWEARFEND
jgi:CubicO group peptidase (beta-lactamase class C family)